MRDPGFDVRAAAALMETRLVLGLLSRLGLLRAGVKDDPDGSIWCKARIELTLDLARDTHDKRLPDDVRSYLYSLLSNEKTKPKRKGKGRPANTTRDHMIVDMIAHLGAKHRINPTRDRENWDKRPQCGCSIVAKVLGELRIAIDETSLETVWTKLAN